MKSIKQNAEKEIRRNAVGKAYLEEVNAGADGDTAWANTLAKMANSGDPLLTSLTEKQIQGILQTCRDTDGNTIYIKRTPKAAQKTIFGKPKVAEPTKKELLNDLSEMMNMDVSDMLDGARKEGLIALTKYLKSKVNHES